VEVRCGQWIFGQYLTRGFLSSILRSVPRTVLHVDMDAFYVSVEILRRPELRGLPVVVGGSSARGVVAAASYEARRYGIHSAMSSVVAHRRCPTAIFLPPDLGHYAEFSAAVHEIFHRFTPVVEPLALDEAFLDVTGSRRLWGSGSEIAEQIRTGIFSEIGLTCSVGVATNKFLAKLASVEAKPRANAEGVTPGTGVWEVHDGTEQDFLDPLEVRRLWGVGPATAEKLEQLGIRRVRDLRLTDPRRIQGRLGRNLGDHLIALAHGRDDRPVVPDRASKSIGNEDTFAEDLTDPEDLRRELLRLADQVTARMRRDGRRARTLTVKVKFADFQTITRSVTTEGPLHDPTEVFEAAHHLLSAVETHRGVRLLGISLHNFGEVTHQLNLFETENSEVADQAWDAIDAIRERFGSGAIGPASLRPRRIDP
jgi:DNA polymerase IV